MSQDDERISVSSMPIPDTLPLLSQGKHPPGSPTPCVMEAASWLADEPWSDHPHSVHPVIAKVARIVNDKVTDEERQELWPWILASLGTARPTNFVLRWQLGRFARRTLAAGRPDKAVWQAVLDRFAELTGHNPELISLSESWHLQARLRRPFDKT